MATWHDAVPTITNNVSSDITAMREMFDELEATIEAMTGGTLGTTEPTAFTILSTKLAAFASGTVMLFGQNSAPTGWTRKADWQDNAMLCYAASGNIAGGGAVNPQSAHTHTGPSHTHTGPAHTHTTSDHTLLTSEIPAHTHDVTFYGSGGGANNIAATSNDASADTTATSSTGGGGAHNHGATASSGTDATGASGTGATGNNSTPYYQELIAATKD